MKILKKILFTFLFSIFTLIICIYAYAWLHPLALDEQRKNITIYDSLGNIMYESNFKKNMQWTSLDDIPLFVQKAFVGVEDKRFYYHAGFDPIRIGKAFVTNIFHGSILQGGSTITQQYAKNLFLTNEKSLSRKVQEFFYATRLEMQYSKKDILEGYLNTIYFGHGVYGVNAASHYFFDKKLSDLTIGETAMLVGIPNGPSIYSPFLNKDNAMKREQLILDVLEHNKIISKQQKEEAKKETLQLSSNINIQTAGINAYYIDAVLSELNKLNIDLNKEIHIRTYYDPSIQKNLQTAVHKNINIQNELEIAGIITQPFTGNVIALMGGKDYTISQFNRAIHSSRQIASTIKPLLYYCALQQGFTPSTQFTSQKTNFRINPDDEYAPTNYGDLYANTKISMINAISLSDNIYAVKTHLFLGIDSLHNALLDFNIRQASPNPSLALGTVNMSLLELSRIYNTFASEGLYIKPAFISNITSRGKEIYKRETQPKRLLQRDETLLLNQMLTSTFDIKNQSYTFPSMYGHQPNVKVAAKSGTSDWDSLVMGYNPEYVIGIWSGFDDNRRLQKEYYPISKNIFRDTFDAIYKNKKGVWYQPSDDIIAKKVNPISGKEDTKGTLYWYKKP